MCEVHCVEFVVDKLPDIPWKIIMSKMARASISKIYRFDDLYTLTHPLKALE